MNIGVLVESENMIGESPTWVPEQHALYWIDVKAPSLHRLNANELAPKMQTWKMPSDIGAFALTADLSGAVVALRTGIFRFDFLSCDMVLLAETPFDPERFRFNEGACDSKGRFWVGTMFDPKDPSLPTEEGSLLCYTFAAGLRTEPDAAEIHNGMAWSPDEKYFYLSHSQKRDIFRFTYEPLSGSVSKRELFTSVRGDDGVPDGAAVDEEGGYWCALHGAGKLRRYFPDGTIDRDVALPVSKPTMCAFGGAHRDRLYITSATDQMSAAQRDKEPLAGAILYIEPGFRGVTRRHTVL